MNLKHALLAGFLVLLCAEPSFAQWGDVASGEGLVEWLTGPVLLLIVTIALIGVIAYGLIQQSIPIAMAGFAGICIVGSVVAFVPEIAQTIVGG